MIKRVCVLLTVLALCAGLCVPVGAVFSDITDPATQTAVSLLQNLGIVAGFEDGTYRPDLNLTRAQFCTLAVLLSGYKDVSSYEGFTIFPDVRGNHWARGYINAAVRELKIVTGFPNGTFEPETPISYAQAVTALMRLLGYTDADVGLNWPHGYLNKAKQIGLLKGITLQQNDLITRGLAAQMFYNAIFTENKSGVTYSDTLGFMEVKVIIMQLDGVGPDGQTHGIVTTGGTGFYPRRAELSIEEGTSGTLLTDRDGYALIWTPDKQTKKEITIKETGPMSATAADGSKIDNIPASAVVYINGKPAVWSGCWVDIPRGSILKFYFGVSGVVDYIIVSQPSNDGILIIMQNEPDAGRNPLPSLGIDANALVFKNGVPASWAFLRSGDVLIYDPVTNIVNATDFRITAVYENGFPSRDAPEQVTTLGGTSFKVLTDVRAKLADTKIGETLTFIFTPDGRIADVKPATTTVYQPGLVISSTSVKLYNGMVLSAATPLEDNFFTGAAVMACMTSPGKLNLKTIQNRGGDVDLDFASMKAGPASIVPYVVIYDLSITGGRALQVGMDVLPALVTSKDVLALNYEAGGRVNLILLGNVTGDAWIYGFTTIERDRYDEVYVPGYDDPFITYLPNLIHIKNQNGTQTFEDPRRYGKDSGDNVCGITVDSKGNLMASMNCVRLNNLRRSDFSGNEAIVISGKLRPIPAGLLVYVMATGEYITVAEARVYSNNFTVFLDKPAEDGGRPRFIIAM